MNYPYLTIKQQIEDTNLELIGVIHNFEEFLKNKEYFIDKIKENRVLVLESPYNGKFWKHSFYGELSKIAHDKKNIIYGCDPITEELKKEDNNMANEIIDLTVIDRVDLAEEYISNLFPKLNEFVGWKNKNEKEFKKKLKTNSLKFLETIYPKSISRDLKIVQATAIQKNLNPLLLENVFPGTNWYSIRTKAKEKDLIRRTVLTLGVTDWRNIKIARGIEKIICRENPEKIISFHGKYHTNPISFYLNNPEIREEKLKFYDQFERRAGDKKFARKFIPREIPFKTKKYNQSWEEYILYQD